MSSAPKETVVTLNELVMGCLFLDLSCGRYISYDHANCKLKNATIRALKVVFRRCNLDLFISIAVCGQRGI